MKKKRHDNPFDDFLFWLDFASIDFSFCLNEIPQNGIHTNSPSLKHIEKPVSEKPPKGMPIRCYVPFVLKFV
jgi:hypothetical protein